MTEEPRLLKNSTEERDYDTTDKAKSEVLKCTRQGASYIGTAKIAPSVKNAGTFSVFSQKTPFFPVQFLLLVIITDNLRG